MSPPTALRPVAGDVVELNWARAKEITWLVAAAFEHDPGACYLCEADRPGYMRRLQRWYGAGAAMQKASGEPILGILDGDRVAGVAVIHAPGGRFPAWAQMRYLSTVALRTNPTVAQRTIHSLRTLEPFRPKVPHFYLAVLAVDPAYHGQGFGGALLHALHARSEAHPTSMGTYLETQNPRNVQLYRHFGYDVAAECPLGPQPCWLMFRRNRRP